MCLNYTTYEGRFVVKQINNIQGEENVPAGHGIVSLLNISSIFLITILSESKNKHLLNKHFLLILKAFLFFSKLNK